MRPDDRLALALRHAVLASIMGLRNGLHYGVKIRAPHSLVMKFLFSFHKPMKENILAIIKMSFAHARNLGAFVLIYKGILGALRVLQLGASGPLTTPPGTPAAGWHALVAGWIGGYIVWAHHNGVNEQIMLYLLSRIVMALFKVLAAKGVKPFSNFTFKQTYPFLTAGVWAIVMWLFECHPKTLQASLEASMKYLYHDTNTWTRGVESFSPSAATVVVLGAMCWMKRQNIAELFDLAAKV